MNEDRQVLSTVLFGLDFIFRKLHKFVTKILSYIINLNKTDVVVVVTGIVNLISSFRIYAGDIVL